MDCKLTEIVLKFVALCLGKRMVSSLVENALDIFLLVFYKHFMFDKCTY